MGKYFGTDGFRGEANVDLTVEHAYKVGRFLGWYYGELKRQNGDDTPAAFHNKAYPSACTSAGDDGTWHDTSAGKRNGNTFRCECCHAKSVTRGCQG